ncbi:MAG: PaaI family thioesterase [Acidobacteriota bacterium]|nr:PaaI family thioesterase [Acidobacteriota bacterium]MDH3523074.1 PaaI family thioesterase [Acidobacteriota bacterium]
MVKKLHELPREELERIFNAAPFVASLGIALVSVGSGECETELVIEPRHLQQDGYIHAGVQATMADHTAGGAAATLAGPDEVVLTAEFKINLLRAARGEKLRCRSRVLKAGSQLTVVESEVFSEREEASTLVSKATVSIAVVSKNRTR